MRALAPVLALALAGCALPPTLPAAFDLGQYAVVSLALSASCVERLQPFAVEVAVANAEARDGTARLIVTARQHGHLVNERVALAALETRTLRFAASIDFAGEWQVYAIAPRVDAPERSIRVVEHGHSC